MKVSINKELECLLIGICYIKAPKLDTSLVTPKPKLTLKNSMEEYLETNSVIPSFYSMLAQFDNHRGAGCSVITEDWQWNRQSTPIFYLLLYYYIVHNLKRS